MRIKKEWIDYAEEHEACEAAIRWLRRKPRTMRQLANFRQNNYPIGISWLSFAFSYGCIPRCARRAARAALRAAEAKDKLYNSQPYSTHPYYYSLRSS